MYTAKFASVSFHSSSVDDLFFGFVPQNKSQNVILFHTKIFGVTLPVCELNLTMYVLVILLMFSAMPLL